MAEGTRFPAYSRKVYTGPQRDRIREALLRFEQDNGIKKRAKLAELVEKESGRKIPRRTLDRFLKNEFAVEDDFINYCEMFLNAVAPPPHEDMLGQALAGYVAPLLFIKGWEKELAGDYDCTARARGGTDADAMLAIRLEAVAKANYLRAVELAPVTDDAGKESSPAVGRRGVLFPFNDTDYLLLLRSYLQSQIYLLRKTSDAPVTLRGQTYIPTGMIGSEDINPDDPWQAETDILMVKKSVSKDSA